MQVIFWIAGALVLLAAVIGAILFLCACGRRKEKRWLDPSALAGGSLEQHAASIQAAHKWLEDHRTEDVSITSFDGFQLHARWIPAEDPKGTVLLAHGYRSTPYLDFGLVLEMYHSLGMNMLIPDQRCHGSSQGRYITFGVKESRDMFDWVAYHNANLSSCEVILSGLSMGASTVLYMADMALPENVKGIIADCGFTSPKAIISYVFQRVTHLSAAPFIWATDICARLFAGFWLGEKDTRRSLKETSLPVILVHGLADDFVPATMSRQGYDACVSEKQLLLVENASHGYSYLVDKERYTALVLAFLHKNLEGFCELRDN